ncbi:hypothetical protein [Spirulina sp. 06S082]|uniref:hypothetical protein n=1 Tax=Spirulina sp. 06S082 TaxID=3110248 RepID=UPI002B1FDFBB|nr:hypothetical protein [Spirulina sp. 06S082]MEA5469340.1 hypothetical protein [Spirulina sp. 06S082]
MISNIEKVTVFSCLQKQGIHPAFVRVQYNNSTLLLTVPMWMRKTIVERCWEIINSLNFYVSRVIIKSEELNSPSDLIWNRKKMDNKPKRILTLNELGLQPVENTIIETEVLKSPYPCGILTMNENKGIFSSAHISIASGTNPEQWKKIKSHKDFFLPDQFDKYMQAIWENAKTNPQGSIEVVYVAPQFTGELFERRVRVRLVNYYGRLCRLVKTIEMRPLT